MLDVCAMFIQMLQGLKSVEMLLSESKNERTKVTANCEHSVFLFFCGLIFIAVSINIGLTNTLGLFSFATFYLAVHSSLFVDKLSQI